MYLDLKFVILKQFNSQADFSQAVGEHESKVSRVIRGRRKLSGKEAKTWAKALRCDMAVFRPVIKER
jgi:hypothetical protein